MGWLTKYRSRRRRRAAAREITGVLDKYAEGVEGKDVAELEREGGWDIEMILTGKAGDGREAAAEFHPRNGLVVVFGGDGTAHEVLGGLNLECCALGVVPAGTGNVLAKELRMARRPDGAAAQLLSARTARLDVGLCNGRRFICVFGAGLDAQAVYRD